tara:strand:- start:322 stop:1065 length:744 start_codon:yes stop_codon:yes gene_type:complete
VLPGSRKEMQFFTKGPAHVKENWEAYLREFPKVRGEGQVALDWPELDDKGLLYEERLDFERAASVHYITGEASADTFCDGSPELLQEHLPELSLVVLLRDPSLRAFSHHRMFRRFQNEGRDLGFAVGDFAEDMRAEMKRAAQGESTPCLTPSVYAPNLERWQNVWGQQLLVLFSSDLDEAVGFPKTMARTLAHVGLPAHSYELAQRYNQAPAAAIPTEIHRELQAYFAPHDRDLAALLGRKLPWQQS